MNGNFSPPEQKRGVCYSLYPLLRSFEKCIKKREINSLCRRCLLKTEKYDKFNWQHLKRSPKNSGFFSNVKTIDESEN